MRCEICQSEITEHPFSFGGKSLCEDCYLDKLATPKTCDPWAVFTAKRTMGQNPTLMPTQQLIYDLVLKEGPLTMKQITSRLSITEQEFKDAFAVLRHMELLRAFKKDGEIFYTKFNSP